MRSLAALLVFFGCSATERMGPCPTVDSEYHANVKLDEFRQILVGRPTYFCMSELRRNAGNDFARVLGTYSECFDINNLYSGTMIHSEFFDVDADGYEDLRCIFREYFALIENEVPYYFTDECAVINLDEQLGMDVTEQRLSLEMMANRDLQGSD